MSADLEDLYREIILDHYRSPRNRGSLETPPATRTEGFNPLCGDEIVVYVDIDDDGVINDIAIDGQGCSISQSSASMMSAAVKGKSVDEAGDLTTMFKTMMSIHAEGIGDDNATDGNPAGGNDGPEPAPARQLKLGDLEALRGVVKFPARIKCATLSWNTLAQAIEEAAAAADTAGPEGGATDEAAPDGAAAHGAAAEGEAS